MWDEGEILDVGVAGTPVGEGVGRRMAGGAGDGGNRGEGVEEEEGTWEAGVEVEC